jgi:hypothetical protein
MLEKLITLGIALICMAYYLKSQWPGIKERRGILTLLTGGILIFLAGVISGHGSWGSTLRLLGTCVFFTGVAVDTAQARKRDQ